MTTMLRQTFQALFTATVDSSCLCITILIMLHTQHYKQTYLHDQKKNFSAPF